MAFGRKGGGELTRQLSSSLYIPNNHIEYQNFFRQSSSREAGYLETKDDTTSDTWKRNYVIFELDELIYGPSETSPREDFTRISINKVISFKIDNRKYGNNTLVVYTLAEHSKKCLYLRAESKEEKSIALVLSHLISIGPSAKTSANFTRTFSSAKHDETGSSRIDERIDISTSYSPPHDPARFHSLNQSSRHSMYENSIPTTSNRSVSTDETYRITQMVGKMNIAMSPAIPILGGSNFRDYHQDKVAGSFTEKNKTANILLSMSPTSSDGNDIDFDDVNDDDDANDNDQFIFDLEENDSINSNSNNGKYYVTSLSNKNNKNSYGAGRSPSSGRSSGRSSANKQLYAVSGSCSIIGPRNVQEDRFIVINNLSEVISSSSSNLMSSSYYAVYDGHGGSHAASYLQEKLHAAISSHPLYDADIEKAIEDTCKDIDADFLKHCIEKKIYSGSTALGVLIRENKGYAFNIGDCQAYLCSDGIAVELNDPHKPFRADEVERIKRAGGWITEEKELYIGRLHNMDLTDPLIREKAEKVSWTTIYRVCGELAVSRSIGDIDYKNYVIGEKKLDGFFIWPEGHDQVFMGDPVIPDPEIRKFDITSKDKYMVIASDGVWDVLAGSEVIGKISAAFAVGKTPTQAAEELCDLAIKLGSMDNVTVVIVQFNF